METQIERKEKQKVYQELYSKKFNLAINEEMKKYGMAVIREKSSSESRVIYPRMLDDVKNRYQPDVAVRFTIADEELCKKYNLPYIPSKY